MKTFLLFILLLMLYGFLFTAEAQIDSIKLDLINHIPVALNRYYFYQDDAKKISDSIKSRFENNLYSDSNLHDFAWQLTADLISITGQKHFDISYTEQDSNVRKVTKFSRWIYFNNPYTRIRFYRAERLSKIDCFNYGQLEILPGNIGYLTINTFENKYSNRHTKRKSLSSVLRKFRNTESIIIDLRNNEGGLLNQVSYLLSFFCSEGEYLYSSFRFTNNSFEGFDRNSLKAKHNYIPKNKRRKLIQKIYILTSNNTFSAGEFAAYLMKKCAKATIIGETTAGGGIGVDVGYSYNNFSFDIPSYETLDTTNKVYSKLSGIASDIAVKSDSAFLVAYKIAIQKNKNFTQAEFTKGLERYSGEFDNLELREDFGKVKIYEKENQLYIKYSFSSIAKLEKINENVYRWKNNTYVKFNSIKAGKKTIEIYWKNKKLESFSVL